METGDALPSGTEVLAKRGNRETTKLCSERTSRTRDPAESGPSGHIKLNAAFQSDLSSASPLWLVRKGLIKVRTMHVPEAQRPFLDSVQEALRRYDEQLKDINHKVEFNGGKTRIDLQLICFRFGRILSWAMKNTRLMITSASSSIVFNQVTIKSAPKPMACRRPWRLNTLTEVVDVLLSSTRSTVRTLNKSPTT